MPVQTPEWIELYNCLGQRIHILNMGIDTLLDGGVFHLPPPPGWAPATTNSSTVPVSLPPTSQFSPSPSPAGATSRALPPPRPCRRPSELIVLLLTPAGRSSAYYKQAFRTQKARFAQQHSAHAERLQQMQFHLVEISNPSTVMSVIERMDPDYVISVGSRQLQTILAELNSQLPDGMRLTSVSALHGMMLPLWLPRRLSDNVSRHLYPLCEEKLSAAATSLLDSLPTPPSTTVQEDLAKLFSLLCTK